MCDINCSGGCMDCAPEEHSLGKTCSCGIYIHPYVRVMAWHIPDCEYYSKQENECVEENNRRNRNAL